MDTNRSEAAALAEIIKGNFTPALQPLGSVAGRPATALLAPEGISLQSIKQLVDEYLPVPDRRKGTVPITDLDSLIAVTKRFKDDESVLFANPDMKAASLTAIFNYNRSGGDVVSDLDGKGVARWGDHRAHYSFPLSEEWKLWIGKNGVVMKQGEFAEFIEDHLADIDMPDPQLVGNIAEQATGGDFGERTPQEQLAALAMLLGGEFAPPARLVELSRGLAVYESSTVKGAINLSTGESTVQFQNSHGDAEGKALKIPNLFLIAIPLWVNGALYRLAVRLRYRTAASQVVWFYQLYRHERVFDFAFKQSAKRAAEETTLPVFYGKPE
jgi:uncharacterized protein YfdQ (DUF2303 family)